MRKVSLDDIDRRLIAELQADGRLTHVTLAARVGLSRSAVQERIARLEREGVILGYTVRLGSDGGAATSLRAYILVNGGATLDRGAKLVEGLPEVKVADSVSGDVDLILQVETERMEDLSRLRGEIARLPGVTSTKTLIVMTPRFDRR